MIIRNLTCLLTILLTFSFTSTEAQYNFTDFFEISQSKVLGGSNREVFGHSLYLSNGNYLIAGATKSNDHDFVSFDDDHVNYLCFLDGNSNVETISAKPFGGRTNYILEDNDHNLVFASDSGGKANISKTDLEGNLIWSRIYDVFGKYSSIKKLIETSDGSYLGVGRVRLPDVYTYLDNHDYLVLKVNNQGDTIWCKHFGGSGDDMAFNVVETHDNGYLVAGVTTSEDGDVPAYYGFQDYWLIKLDSDGQIIWSKNYGGTGFDGSRQLTYANRFGLSMDNNGNFILFGYTSSSDHDVESNTEGTTRPWFVKISSTGNIISEHCLSLEYTAYGRGILQLNNGHYLALIAESGIGYNAEANYNFVIAELDTNGTLISSKSFGGRGTDLPYSLDYIDDNHLIIGGSTTSADGDVGLNKGEEDVWILKLNRQFSTASDFIINDCDSVEFQGEFLKHQGTYYDTLLSTVYGFDSIIVGNLSVRPKITNLNESICYGDSIFMGNRFLKSEGLYTDTLFSQCGNDSIVNLDLKVLHHDSTKHYFYLYPTDSIYSGNSYKSEPGLHIDTLQSICGFDSIVYTYIDRRINTKATKTVCNGDLLDVSIWMHEEMPGTLDTIIIDHAVSFNSNIRISDQVVIITENGSLSSEFYLEIQSNTTLINKGNMLIGEIYNFGLIENYGSIKSTRIEVWTGSLTSYGTTAVVFPLPAITYYEGCQPYIYMQNDTIFSNITEANNFNWTLNGNPLNQNNYYVVPEENGSYRLTIRKRIFDQESNISNTYYFHIPVVEEPLTLANKTEEHKLYPIPARDMLYLETDNFTNKYYEIYSYKGKLLGKGKIESHNMQIPISNLNSGFYIFRIVSDNTVETIKFSKR